MTGTLEITREGDTTYVAWHGPQGRVPITTDEMDHLIGVLAGWRAMPPLDYLRDHLGIWIE